MDRMKRNVLPFLGLAGVAILVISMLPGREPGLSRTMAGFNQPAATISGPLSNLCSGWGHARRDCAAFVRHFMNGLAESRPELGLCVPPPAALAEWTVAALHGVPADEPWAAPLEAALTQARPAPPLPPCAPEKARPT
ncbi:hypothetical protein [Roseomonas marmotae]|uniref:Rap1a immunity protein domain-containing protein n=1 Tax=Roseomonas marmotae TaxID=2768161 RepID=A0ABS3K6A7_9PROT|nr:hypothetical protein [Roseomonas marmotae]MBO1072988.1 hypothetical protein [Roseomonas marmotae]QTI79363.1 hypothetical protein IAI58_00540 [Roseomonas marmotae]